MEEKRMPKILQGSQRALTGEEFEFAIKNMEAQQKSFEQRYQDSVAKSEEENARLEEQLKKNLNTSV